jgi:hypothetical protein
VHVKTKDLAPSIRSALKGVGYGAADIEVIPADEISVQRSGYGAGSRGFSTLVDLSTGRHETLRGSFGGPGLGSRGNRVDLDRSTYPIPAQTVVIQGSEGHPRTFASIYAPPDTLASLSLAAPKLALSPGERDGLNIIGAYVSSYRPEAFRRAGVTPADIDALVARGLVRRNAAGAVSITTAGKNVRSTLPRGAYRRRVRRSARA